MQESNPEHFFETPQELIANLEERLSKLEKYDDRLWSYGNILEIDSKKLIKLAQTLRQESVSLETLLARMEKIAYGLTITQHNILRDIKKSCTEKPGNKG